MPVCSAGFFSFSISVSEPARDFGAARIYALRSGARELQHLDGLAGNPHWCSTRPTISWKRLESRPGSASVMMRRIAPWRRPRTWDSPGFRRRHEVRHVCASAKEVVGPVSSPGLQMAMLLELLLDWGVARRERER
jgi:hypothetical protein